MSKRRERGWNEQEEGERGGAKLQTMPGLFVPRPLCPPFGRQLGPES